MTSSQKQSLLYQLVSLGLSFLVLICYTGVELHSMITYAHTQISSFHSKKSINMIQQIQIFQQTNLMPIFGIKTLNPTIFDRFNLTHQPITITHRDKQNNIIKLDLEELKKYINIQYFIITKNKNGQKSVYISDVRWCKQSDFINRGGNMQYQNEHQYKYSDYLCPNIEQIKDRAIITSTNLLDKEQIQFFVSFTKCRSDVTNQCKPDKAIKNLLSNLNFIFYMISDQLDIDDQMKYGSKPIKTTLEFVKTVQLEDQRIKAYGVGIRQNTIETQDSLFPLNFSKQKYKYYDIEPYFREIDLLEKSDQIINGTRDGINYKILKYHVYGIVDFTLSKNYNRYFRKVYNIWNFLSSLGGIITIVLSVKRISDFLILSKLQTGSTIQQIFEQSHKYGRSNDDKDGYQKQQDLNMEQLFLEQFNEQLQQYRSQVDPNTNLFNTNLLQYFNKDRSLLQFTIFDQLIDYNFMWPLRWLLKKTPLIRNYSTFSYLKKVVETITRQDNLVKNQMLFQQFVLNKVYKKKQKLYDKQIPIHWGSEIDLHDVDFRKIQRRIRTKSIIKTNRYHRIANKLNHGLNHPIQSSFKSFNLANSRKKDDSYQFFKSVYDSKNRQSGRNTIYKRLTTQQQMGQVNEQDDVTSNQLVFNSINKYQNSDISYQRIPSELDNHKEQSASSLTKQICRNEIVSQLNENFESIKLNQIIVKKIIP